MLRKICPLLFVLILVYSISQAIELNPRDAKVYYNQGIAWYNKGDYDRAISDFNKAIELNPRYANAYNNRGIVWAKTSNHDRAISDFNKAIELNPKLVETYKNQGNARSGTPEKGKTAMIWWIIGAIATFLVFRFLWRGYTHPASVLARQAANMNWVSIGRVEGDEGFKDVCYGRDEMEVKISYATGRVFLLKPAHVEPFKDFIELDRWLAKREDSSPKKTTPLPKFQ